ncbi:MAG: hypothetical protein WCW31_05995, partial [Patescibacteria group bacterium]
MAISSGLFGTLSFALPASAQVDAGLNTVGNTIGLTATDPRTIAANIINIALGFLGILTLCLVLYAGFLWMTAGGDAAKTEKAKKYLINSIIGLIIIISAWAIATFAINALLN